MSCVICGREPPCDCDFRRATAPTEPAKPTTGEELTDFFRKEFKRYLHLYERKCAQLSRFIERKNAIEAELSEVKASEARLAEALEKISAPLPLDKNPKLTVSEALGIFAERICIAQSALSQRAKLGVGGG